MYLLLDIVPDGIPKIGKHCHWEVEVGDCQGVLLMPSANWTRQVSIGTLQAVFSSILYFQPFRHEAGGINGIVGHVGGGCVSFESEL